MITLRGTFGMLRSHTLACVFSFLLKFDFVSIIIFSLFSDHFLMWNPLGLLHRDAALPYPSVMMIISFLSKFYSEILRFTPCFHGCSVGLPDGWNLVGSGESCCFCGKA